MSELELLARIDSGINILVGLQLLTFVMSCLRAWRVRTLKMGE